MATNNTRLQVAIVGSGIAGLAAARILREKHEVTVYERGEPSVTIGGQGIANFPNSTHILSDMGFDYKRVGSVELGGWRTVDKYGKYLHGTEFNTRERYGSPLVSHMRVDVRTELLRLATAPPEELGLDTSANPAIMVWNNGAVDLDAEAGRITLEDGSTVEADVVIGKWELNCYLPITRNKPRANTKLKLLMVFIPGCGVRYWMNPLTLERRG